MFEKTQQYISHMAMYITNPADPVKTPPGQTVLILFY